MTRTTRTAIRFSASLSLAALTLSACGPSAPRPSAPPSSAALPVMERVALGANACWFKSKDPAFASYRLAPELNSFSGRPRILLVHAHSPESRPLLVVQAEGNPARLDAFGPVMNDAIGGRVSADVNRWASGNRSCQ